MRCLLERRPEARFLVAVRRTRKELRTLSFLLTVFAVKRMSINDTATIRNVSKPSAIRSLVPYVHTRFAKLERFSIMGSSTGHHCLPDVEQQEGLKLARTVYLRMASMSANV